MSLMTRLLVSMTRSCAISFPVFFVPSESPAKERDAVIEYRVELFLYQGGVASTAIFTANDDGTGRGNTLRPSVMSSEACGTLVCALELKY